MSAKRLTNLSAPSADRQPFFVCALPRSGTAWLSNFLTWGDCFCMHEGLCGCSSFEELQEQFDQARTTHAGCCDTAIAHVLPYLYQYWPKAKYVFIIRNLADIGRSLTRLNFEPHSIIEPMLFPFWWGISNIPGAMVIDFKDLFSSVTMTRLWDFLEIRDPFPFQRFQMLRDMHIEEGLYTGLGRFGDPRVIEQNQRKFQALCMRVTNDPSFRSVEIPAG